MAEKIYYCEGCGGVMEWDPVSQQLKCPNCGNIKKIVNDARKVVEHKLTLDARRKIQAQEKESQTMQCQGCGARIEIQGHETAAKCPYCGSSYVLAKKQEDVIKPDGVIPFKLDKNGVRESFSSWMKHRWLAPNELKRLYQQSGFQGIYVPYWTFDADCQCPYEAEGGIRRTESYTDSKGNRQTREYVDWYPTRGYISHFFDDVQTAASVRFKQGLLSGLEPYDFKQLVSYSPAYISGYLSENYSIGLEDGHQDALKKMISSLRNMASNEVRRQYDEVRNVNVHPSFSNETYKYTLVPVYSTTYYYKNRNYAVVINAQNGKVKGEYPKSPVKIALLILLAVIILLLCFVVIPAIQDADSSADAAMVPWIPAIQENYEATVCSTVEEMPVLDAKGNLQLEFDDIIVYTDL